MARIDLSSPEAAGALGIEQKLLDGYQKGMRDIPRIVALACWALEYGAPRTTAPYTPTGKSRRVGEPTE